MSVDAEIEAAARLLDAGDFVRAAEILEPLCGADVAQALYLRSTFALPSEGTDSFDARRISMLERASLLGSADAQYALAVHHDTGDLVPRSAARHSELIAQAAASGQPHALWRYGLMQVYGTSLVPRHAEAGLRLVFDAARLGSEGALRTLSEWYAEGAHGLPVDLSEATRLRELAHSGSIPI